MLVTMTVDTEEEWDWTSGWPTRDLSIENVRMLPRFQALCANHGIRPTYFVNRAVLDAPLGREIVSGLAADEGVEIGMHIHPWNTPPFDPSRPVAPPDTFLHNYPVGELREKLRSVLDTFASCGLTPRSFRGGRYSSGGAIHDFLRDRGFVADASVVPFSTWLDAGAPDYRHRDLAPRRLAPRGPQDAAFWEVPLTLGFTRRPFALWAALYRTIEASMLRNLRLIGVMERLGIVRKVWLNFEEPLGLHMDRFLDVLTATDLPSICFTIHSSSLMAGKNGYTPTPEAEQRLFARMDKMFERIRRTPGLEPATVSEVAAKLERDHHARAGH
jgi:hypothetical protein